MKLFKYSYILFIFQTDSSYVVGDSRTPDDHVSQAEDNADVKSSKGPTTSGYTNKIKANYTVTAIKDVNI